jgi:hypothetical protein
MPLPEQDIELSRRSLIVLSYCTLLTSVGLLYYGFLYHRWEGGAYYDITQLAMLASAVISLLLMRMHFWTRGLVALGLTVILWGLAHTFLTTLTFDIGWTFN